MHELSIVQSLVALCEKKRAKLGDESAKISEVVVKIGVLSGVEPHYLQSAFDVYKIGGVCDEASLKILHQPLIVKCEKCGFSGELEQNEFICPKCASVDLDVKDGEDMYLMKIIFDG